jgi:alpha-tubulin suppressor-like RCC1 family protein
MTAARSDRSGGAARFAAPHPGASVAMRMFIFMAILLAAALPRAAAAIQLPPATQVVFGETHGCALVGGGVYCWGNNGDGQLGDNSYHDRGTPVPVLGLRSGVSAIAIGGFHSCALISGAVKCWGYNADGELGNGSTLDRATPVAVQGLGSGVSAIAAGKYHTCAILSGGSIRCWGWNNNGQLGDNSINPTGSGMPATVANIASGTTAISAGSAHTCAVVGGGLQCWGRNPEGQLNDGSVDEKHVPSPSPTLTSGILALMAGGYHTCAIMTGGELRCWGWNGYGQLGDSSVTSTKTGPAVAVSGLGSGVASVAGGYAHTCAVVNGAAKCWGYNRYGQIGNNSVANSAAPQPVSGIASGATAVAAGAYSSCAQVTVSAVSRLDCWGFNASGQIGRGDEVYRTTPVAVSGIASGATLLGQGADGATACASVGGAAQCWGYGEDGELGNGSNFSRNVSVPVTGLTTNVTSLASGNEHTCAVANGAAMCWGSNASGQLGNNSTTASYVPVTAIASGVTAISAGYAYSCAIVGTGVKCWGANPDGELGDGSTDESHMPVSVTGLTGTPIALSTGVAHTCALITGGTVQCWGYNNSGQLGNNSTASTLTGPATAVSNIVSGATAVVAGGYFTCAIVSGAAKCWGFGPFGQLGNGMAMDSHVPVGVTGLGSGVTAIAAGRSHACAVAGGTTSCWGAGYYGQLGNGSTFAHTTPTPVIGLPANASSLGAYESSTCALLAGGTVSCWGVDSYGTLGDGRVIRQLQPSLVVTNDALFGFAFEYY